MLDQFYRDVLPGQGNYCLFLLPERAHVWASDIDTLAGDTAQLSERGGVYFGTAAFSQPTNRTQTNVAALRALRLDIDAGPEKFAKHGDDVYETQELALAALVPFFKTTRLLPTYLVSSGAGLHVYFCLDEDIDPASWKRLALALAKLCDQHSLKIDGSVTTDSARVLRPLGMLHPNGTRVRLLARRGTVYSVDGLRANLPALDPVPSALARHASINDELDLGYGNQPSSAIKAASHCGALREVAESGGDVPEPHWRGMLGLVKRTVEGVGIAHEWSAGYEGYDPAEVERKFGAWATGPTTCAEFSKHTRACDSCKFRGKVKSPISLGLLTQDEIDAQDPQPEPELPTPAPATPAPAARTQDPWVDQLPEHFQVVCDRLGRDTLVHTMVIERESETGEAVPVQIHVPFTHDIFWLGQWSEAFDTNDTAQVTFNLWTRGTIKRYLLDQSLIASPPKLQEFLAGKSILLTDHKHAGKAMQSYIKASIEKIRAAGHRPKIGDHLGIRILDDGRLVAVQGKHVIYPDGRIEEAMLTPGLQSVACQYPVPVPAEDLGAWGPEVWDSHIMPRAQQHLAFLRKYYGGEGMEKFQLAIMMALASPLMAFTNGGFFAGSVLPVNSSLSVSLYSRKSARGKTTAAQAAVLAFGKAGELADDAGTLSATDLARMGRLPLLGSLPNVMDEMGGATARAVAQAVSAVANGTGRKRMSQKGQMVAAPPFALVNIVTTNRSQRDMIAAVQDSSGAIQYRLLEIDVDDMPEYDQALRSGFSEDWANVNRDCPGALGAVIHREICALGVARINEAVAQACAKASALLDSAQTARFQYRGLGALMALHLLLNRLGMAPFKLASLVQAFRVAHDAGEAFVAANTLPDSGVDLLGRALQDLAPHTLVTEGETRRARNSPDDAYDRPLNERGVPDVIKARHIRSLGVTYLSVDALKAWAREHEVSERAIVSDALAAGVIEPYVSGSTGNKLSAEYYVLTKGLRSDMRLRLRCYKVQTRKITPPNAEDQ